VLEAFVHHAGDPDAGPWGVVVLVGLVLGSVLTFAYSARFMWGAFAVKPGVEPTQFKAVRPSFIAAPAILSVLTIAYGLWPAPVDTWIQPYAALFASTAPDAGTPAEQAGHLALWHGLTPALGLTTLTFVLGAAMYFGRNAVARAQALVPDWVDADRAYQLTIGALDDIAVWITGRTQRGSLYFYLAVILTVAFVLPLTAILFAGKPLPDNIYLVDPGSPLQIVAGIGIVIGALAAVKANKRFLAVLMVSVTGYGIALMFALQGAPDLALTQMLVETIILVAFVLGMRRLPPELREATPVGAGTLLGIGLATAAASGVVPLLLGGQVFQSAIIELWLPVFGDIKFVTSTLFDIGVYIVVLGLVLDVLRSLGSEIDEHFDEHQTEPAPDSLVEDVMAGAAPDEGPEPLDLSTQSTLRGRG
jgi:multicomponent Na+:H+ antiporter subunit A